MTGLTEHPAATAWLVSGPPGSGKSTLGGALARTLPAVLVDQDVATGPLTRVVSNLVDACLDDLDDPRVRTALGDAAYEAVLDIAAANLALGSDVVVVAPFSRLLATTEAAAWVRRRLGGRPMRVVATRCPANEVRRRLEARGAPRDRRKLAASGTGREPTPLAVTHALVDSTAPLPAQLAAAVTAPEAVDLG